MGLNIHVYKIIEKSMEQTWGGKTVPYYIKQEPDWWDCSRFSGDRDFASENEFAWFSGEHDEDELRRPVDIDKCIEWINEKVVDGNIDRLLRTMDEFKKDENLTFYFSY